MALHHREGTIFVPFRRVHRKTSLADQHFQRFTQLKNWEQYLYENGYRFLKIFLNVSKDKQRQRFIERIDTEEKNWKFSAGDLDESELWPQYMDAFEKAIDATSTPENPWYVIPADQKFFARYLVSEAMVATLEACAPEYPQLTAEEIAEMEACRPRLA